MTNKEEKNQFSVMTSLKMVKIRLSKKKMKKIINSKILF